MIGLNATGFAELEKALDLAEQRIRAATRKATSEGIRLATRTAHAQLSRYSHAPGTPTSAPPGGPPARISGTLRGSLNPTGPVPTGGGFIGRLGPTAAYSRVQELGGATGRGHATTLPARPYMRPTYDRLISEGTLQAVFAQAWGRAL